MNSFYARNSLEMFRKPSDTPNPSPVLHKCHITMDAPRVFPGAPCVSAGFSTGIYFILPARPGGLYAFGLHEKVTIYHSPHLTSATSPIVISTCANALT